MKKTCFLLGFLFTLNISFAQSFMHGAGITILGSTTGEGSNSDIGFGEGFTYTPRFNFFETQSLSVSVSIPLVIGISAITSTTYDQYGSYDNSSVGFIAQVPVIVSLNLGRGSSKENRNKMGYFVGAGYGYYHGDFLGDNYDAATDTYTTTYSSNTFGPAANAGIRIGVGRKHKSIEIRLSYMKGLNEHKPNILGVAALFNF